MAKLTKRFRVWSDWVREFIATGFMLGAFACFKGDKRWKKYRAMYETIRAIEWVEQRRELEYGRTSVDIQ